MEGHRVGCFFGLTLCRLVQVPPTAAPAELPSQRPHRRRLLLVVRPAMCVRVEPVVAGRWRRA